MMAAPLQNTRHSGAIHGIKCVVYGRAGLGKTFLCSTAPAPVIISAESGVLSLSKFDIPYWAVYNINDFKQATQWAMQSQEARQFATICIDSVSEIAEQILAYEKTRNKDARQAYGAVIDEMLTELRKFRNLSGPNVYMTCKQDTYKDAFGSVFNRPLFPGQQLPMQVPYFPDELWQILPGKDQQGKFQPYLRCHPDQFNEAKDRSGKLAEYEPAHLSYLFAKMLG